MMESILNTSKNALQRLLSHFRPSPLINCKICGDTFQHPDGGYAQVILGVGACGRCASRLLAVGDTRKRTMSLWLGQGQHLYPPRPMEV